mmetsp:Transcript_39657/g.60739  ORF Transcript_39657/g.60739 Transcript_39657/m.60739 type:complete len:121 (+) Transcript_39657:1662-2024(+)|eukprot:CAMPEP_0170507912 /NCGR_PEP_ID=MMETSP0208-20121228/60569_1 /TAXON_ID=197538 /ORGANISM="Strombidium inclinatum, Strain S3" /LENGTH=120 /DNA_ID=CAMNT_0010790463 /DNA_START=1577 /DNA_END=1939 /DNA_ORIENTATION=-
MEEYYSNLQAVRASGLYKETNEELRPTDMSRTQKHLWDIGCGNKVIGAKDYMMVFFITCFLPFVRPSIQQLKEHHIAKARKHQRKIIGEFREDPAVKEKVDFDFLAECKETMKLMYSNKD